MTQLSRLYRSMKNIKVIPHLGTLFLALAISLPVQAQNMSGVMMVVKGDIKITSTDGKTDAGKVGRKVTAGDVITSGADSRAKIVMADKNVINVSPDSKIVIEKYENDGKDKKNVELNVLYGKVRASVEQKYDGEKNKFNIKTPSAVAGVRGTDFMAGYNSQTRVTQVITFSGSVALGQPGPGGSIRNPVFVMPGQMAQAGAGQAPAAPVQVPKDDLNKANTETNPELASTPAPSSAAPGPEALPSKETAANPEPTSDSRGPASDAPAPTPAASTPPPPAMAPPLPGAPNSAPIVGPAPMIIPRVPTAYVPPTNTFVDNIPKKVNLNITITPAN